MHIYAISRKVKQVKHMRRRTQGKRLNALLNAKASLAIEGMRLTEREEQLILKRANGKMKNADFLKLATEIAKNV